ncbi:beta-N-acetylhexosaminidase [Niallia nealsonii]|uniref:Beta-N-acetylhexosaminidase n=1 Tax=Niallia nealsonii TaxID=115979 RepID=A0A2N0Z070_9BACI|nr:beta-N-acetylhexosaminidase [Niallia nealsonii]PKG22906.1 beta-N-acetylhexosaminidase [Niallia nealsonii]
MRKSRSKQRSINPFPLLIAVVLAVISLSLIFYLLFGSSQAKEEKEESTDTSLEKNSHENAENKKEVASAKEVQSVSKEQQKSEATLGAEDKNTTFFDENTTIEEKVTNLVAKMTLQEKIGQLMVVGFQSNQPDEHIKTMINDYKVGGVILFDRNMINPEQVASLNNQLQNLAMKNEKQIPLTISIDQEGGQIVRMREQVSTIPSQQSLGQKNNPKAVYDTAYHTGTELSAMGFNVNFAPVLDLSDTDSRSFGTDPEKVNTLGSQVVTGLMDSGMVATLKHFPGNGRSNVDPHIETSSVEANKLDLETKDIYPFKKMIENVDNNRFYIMVTHIKYPTYDKVNPASISPIIIQDLLRKELGFKGIVVTDDLEMGAVNKYFTYEDLGYNAIKAGADMLLVCHTFENQQRVFNGIIKAVESKKLSEERIDESVKRILTNKLTVIKNTQVDPVKAEAIIGK